MNLDGMKYLGLRRRWYIEYLEKRKVEKSTEDEDSGWADPPHPPLRLMVPVRPCFDSFITRPAPSPQVGELVCSKSWVFWVFPAAVSSLQCATLSPLWRTYGCVGLKPVFPYLTGAVIFLGGDTWIVCKKKKDCSVVIERKKNTEEPEKGNKKYVPSLTWLIAVN